MSLRDIKELPSTMVGADLAPVASISETSHERLELFTTFSVNFVNAEAKNYFLFSHLFCQRISCLYFVVAKLQFWLNQSSVDRGLLFPCIVSMIRSHPPGQPLTGSKRVHLLWKSPRVRVNNYPTLAWLALACINTRPVIHLCAIDHRLSTWACDICDGAVTR